MRVFVICIIVREIIIEEKYMKSAWHKVRNGVILRCNAQVAQAMQR
ncbi:hypothetical protein [Bacillus mycoides]|nr:hypothetical protein [Bacillus mycoides]